MPYEDAMPKMGNPFHLERVDLNEQEQRRLINRVEDISKAIFKYRRVERNLYVVWSTLLSVTLGLHENVLSYIIYLYIF